MLVADRAREEGFCKRTAESPEEVRGIYRIGRQSAIDDPTLGQEVRPVWIKLEGPLDTGMVSFLTRSLELARQQKTNLLFLQINSSGGVDTAGENLVDKVAAIKGMKTVAYIDDRATGVAALVPLACRDIVFRKSAQMGDVPQMINGRQGHLHDLDDRTRTSLAKKAAILARQHTHPDAVAVAMVDPDVEVVEAKDSKTGAARLILRMELDAEPGRFQAIEIRKEPGSVLTVASKDAESYGLGQVVNDDDELKALYGLRGPRDPHLQPKLGRLVRHHPHGTLRELAPALHRGLYAHRRAQVAWHRAAGDHLRFGVPSLLLEPLLKRHRRSA